MPPMRTSARTRAAAALLAAVVLAPAALVAATPGSGTLSEQVQQTSWTGGPKLATASACSGPNDTRCDLYRLTIQPPPFPFEVEIVLTPELVSDYDLEVYGTSGQLLGTSGNVAGQAERLRLTNPAAGTYTVAAAPFIVLTKYSATAKILPLTATGPSTATPPTYSLHAAPTPLGTSAGEPTLGVNEATGAVMYIAGLETLKVTFDDSTTPATAAWADKSYLTTSLITFDPILWTDQQLGRTFVSQLLPTKISLMAFTDDDGDTWTPSMGAGINSGLDHQSVGGGPFAPGLLGPLGSYPHAVYYCSQDIALAECAVSRDGGLTFGPAVPIYSLLDCGGLHGHVKVGPDGVAYVPNKNCQGEQGVAVSADNGLTWRVKRVPGSTPGEWDPSVATAADGTLYFGFAGSDGHAYAAVSHDGGDTWTGLQDVGAALGLENIAFPAMIAGDADRAAFAFLGTTAEGDAGGEDPNFPAAWHLYVAHTYDGGQTWVTVNATPGDPVQRGTICSAGTTCGPTRNLLDFMDATVDAEGRVLVSFADGCLGPCVAAGPNTGSALATIARQKSGKRLYAAFD